MAKVLFINPVVREEDVPRHIPYGMALLASIAMNRGHQIQVYDANAWRKGDEILIQVLEADDWDVVAIGGLTTTYNYVKKTFKMAREYSPDSLLMAGGGFLTSMPKEIMEWIPEIDLGVVGEAYVTFPEILDMLDEGNKNFSPTLGVIRRETDGKPVLNATRPNINNLDDLPWPAWDLFPLDIYFQNSANLFSEEGFTSKRRLDVMGSVGCGLICRYCWHLGTTGEMLVEEDEQGENDVVFTYGRNIRYFSAKYIVKMVKHLHENYDIDLASFIDENFMTMNAYSKGSWLRELCEEWIAEGLQPTCRRDGVPHDENCTGVHWNGTSHAGLHNPKILKLMHEAGCSHLVYGLEAFDPVILKNLGKGATKKMNMESVKICLDSGIKPIPNVIIGFPEESFDSIRAMIEALTELNITAMPHFATPYPGSEWFYTYKQTIIEQYGGDLEAFIKDLGDASQISTVISHKFSAMELLGLQNFVYTKNLRLLNQAEHHWGNADELMNQIASPAPSFNIRRNKERSPIEESRRSFDGEFVEADA
jgi:anaerobic magnesium-protoporphyrin IX monomethyl ester cyclase